ncbi:MAG: gamma-glutamyltransferase family protein [Candidatus Fervidibacter sp.]|uniref:gamma-glutamyltransferase family protein n=1 Tax=Candidatus Fervidibacter sp. TaxID=3100871 RepID=UPI00404922E5
MMKLPAWSTKGMVVAEHPLASLVGRDILKRDGNFADATVAISAMLSVVTPHLCGLGGDFFGLFWLANEKRAISLNGSGCAPKRLNASDLGKRHRNPLPTYSPLTVTVPGLVDALWQLHSRYGRLPWRDLWQPAIGVARDGFSVSTKLAAAISVNAKRLAKDEGAKGVFLANGKPLKEGQTLKQPALARTLEQIAGGGRNAFYSSELTKAMVKYLNGKGNPVTVDDFAAQESLWDQPISWRNKKLTVLEIPPNSLGFATLQSMAVLRAFPLENLDLTELTGLVGSVARLVAKERDEYLADPRYVPHPPEVLLRDERVTMLRQKLTSNSRHVKLRALGDTTYFAVVDSEGNAVSAIQSIFHNFGSGIMDPQTGVLFHNRGANFVLKANHPNELAGGKRPRHTLSAVMVLEGQNVKGVLGTSGGDYRPTIHAWLMVHWFYRGKSLQEAIEMPRVLWQGENRLLIEQGAGDPETLKRSGWQVQLMAYPALFGTGVSHGIEKVGGSWCGCADIRGEGLALPI